jgi:hypothetical protein
MENIDRVRTPIGEKFCGQIIGNGVRQRRTRRVNAQRHNARSLYGNQVSLNQFLPDGRTVAYNAGRSLKSIQNVPRHGAKETGTAVRLRREYARECIEVVTRNKGAFSWETMRELRIAMVNDVEQVKVGPVAGQPERVLCKAMNQPVGRKSEAARKGES